MFAVFIVVALTGLVITGIAPLERGTWWLEVAPVVLALPILFFTRKRFPLTPLAYGLIAVHAVILMVGGHYTTPRCRSASGWSRRSAWPAILTTASGISRRDSSLPSSLARSCFAARRSSAAHGCLSSSSRSVLRSAPVTNSSNGGQR